MTACAGDRLESAASLSRRFLLKGVSLVFLFPLSKHLADVATVHTLTEIYLLHSVCFYRCSLQSVSRRCHTEHTERQSPSYKAIVVTTHGITTLWFSHQRIGLSFTQSQECVSCGMVQHASKWRCTNHSPFIRASTFIVVLSNTRLNCSIGYLLGFVHNKSKQNSIKTTTTVSSGVICLGITQTSLFGGEKEISLTVQRLWV